MSLQDGRLIAVAAIKKAFEKYDYKISGNLVFIL